MRIHTTNHCQGSVLVISLLVATIIGISLASYLTLISNQNRAVARAQTWNAAMPVAEAGVEEALTQLTYGGCTNLSMNGWAPGADGAYHKTRTLPDGSSYGVAILPLSEPVIMSTGYTAFPELSARLSRVVQVTATNAPVFSPGLIARGNIDLNGNGVSSDSYDSSVGPYSASTAGTNGDVASADGLVSVGNADIHGSLILGPGATNTIGSNGSISGSIYHDFNMDFPDVQPPFTSGGVPPLSGVVNKTNYDYVLNGLNGGLFQVGSLKGSVCVSSGNNVLYVTGDATFSTLIIAPGASVQIYVGGANTTFQRVYNNTGRPLNLQYYGLPGNTSIALHGNYQFVGTIYAPEANLSANGGGSDTLDFRGAAIVNTVSAFTGHVSFHFDESLKKDGPIRYVVASWHELGSK
jgi:hypothetical protein